ncbi:hypothetical protein DAA48_21830 [Aeromonas veronii]|uniref:Uncharacterized protein n=1 Tax=Aeromonas veronii TaxID=654 RepID=A0A2T4MWV8_AERVE|nr:hypothetical protein DAA48_21830 [Aeromonas veronii]
MQSAMAPLTKRQLQKPRRSTTGSTVPSCKYSSHASPTRRSPSSMARRKQCIPAQFPFLSCLVTSWLSSKALALLTKRTNL